MPKVQLHIIVIVVTFCFGVFVLWKKLWPWIKYISVVTQAITWCRSAMVMMQYSVMANNYWLLVEGIYLHSLLVITVFSEKKYFYIYMAIGWGKNHGFRSPGMCSNLLREGPDFLPG